LFCGTVNFCYKKIIGQFAHIFGLREDWLCDSDWFPDDHFFKKGGSEMRGKIRKIFFSVEKKIFEKRKRSAMKRKREPSKFRRFPGSQFDLWI
jgi:hypothetical protein